MGVGFLMMREFFWGCVCFGEFGGKFFFECGFLSCEFVLEKICIYIIRLALD